MKYGIQVGINLDLMTIHEADSIEDAEKQSSDLIKSMADTIGAHVACIEITDSYEATDDSEVFHDPAMTPGEMMDAVLKQLTAKGYDSSNIAFSATSKTGHLTVRHVHDFHIFGPIVVKDEYSSNDVYYGNVDPLVAEFIRSGHTR